MTERSAAKARVLEIYDYKCANYEVCGNDDVTVHHIIFKREGGEDIVENYCVLCRECHAKLHEKVDVMEGYSGGLSKKEKKRRRAIFRRKKR